MFVYERETACACPDMNKADLGRARSLDLFTSVGWPGGHKLTWLEERCEEGRMRGDRPEVVEQKGF